MIAALLLPTGASLQHYYSSILHRLLPGKAQVRLLTYQVLLQFLQFVRFSLRAGQKCGLMYVSLRFKRQETTAVKKISRSLRLLRIPPYQVASYYSAYQVVYSQLQQ